MSSDASRQVIQSVKLQGVDVPYTIRRSERARHLRITISPGSGVVITMPARLPQYIDPEQFLREKAAWVLKHYTSIPPAVRRPRQIRNGSRVIYRGQHHTVKIIRKGTTPKIVVTGDQIHATIPEDYATPTIDLLRAWMISQARIAIERVVVAEAARIGVTYVRVNVRDQKTKWGSCSRQGGLSFNWRLILFPPHILRYVVVHELCHIRHFDHSERFWGLVGRHDKSYREHVDWLRDHGPRIGGDLS